MRKYIILFIIILLLAVNLYAQPAPISPWVIRYLDLIDSPATYSGQALKYVRVNAGATALEFAAVAGGGDLLSDGSVPLTADWDVGNYGILAKYLQIDTADASDPLLIFKTTNTANQINITLDEDKADDWLRIAGQTAAKDTILAIDALDGENAYLRLHSGLLSSFIGHTSGDNLVLGNNNSDKDIIMSVYDGGVYKWITWDSSEDKLTHSAGTFNFDDDNLTTTGTFEAATITEGGTGVYNITESDAAYQPLEATLTDIADGTINENLVNTANPWADDEIADAHSHAADAIDAITEIAAALKSGADAKLITGTAAANGNLSMWNADGDLVDASVTAAALAAIDTEAELEALLELQDLQGAVTDAQVPDNITIDLATLATTASAGDAALNFFGAGVTAVTDGTACTDIEGTGLSIAAGTLNWSAASTDLTDSVDLLYEAELDDLSELITQMADVTAFITDDDMPAAGTDPDIDAAGEIGRDTDGADESGDSSLRGHDGSNQFLYSKKLKHITVSITNPDSITGWTGRANKSQPIWFNTSGMTFTITEIYAISDADNYDFNLFESNSATDMSDENDTLIDLVECEADGTEAYTDTETTISHAAIEHDHAIIFEHSDGDAGGIIITITGWFNSNID